MKLRLLSALLRKEMIMIMRHPLLPRVIFMMPVMIMLIMPLVANLEVKNARVAVVDNDRSQLSRRIVSDMDASPHLCVTSLASIHSGGMSDIEKGRADVLVTIPRGYSQMPLPLDIEANGVNATKGMIGSQYVAQSITATLRHWQEEQGGDVAVPGGQVAVLNRYNPTLNFRNYMIPALMVTLLIVICGFIPALDLVSEKETGTIEAINVSPVSPLLLVMSKLIPFWAIGLFVITVGMAIGWGVYGLVPQGSIWGIYGAALLFSFVMSGFGITVANKSSTMLQSIFVMFAFVLIFQLLSGLFTPIDSMPQWAQWLTYAIPPRYFIEIIRAIYLRATPVSALMPQYLALTLFAIFACLLASKSYRKQT